MKILFAYPIDAPRLLPLIEQGHECRVQPDLIGAELTASISGVDILVVGRCEVTSTTIQNADQLSMIIRAGEGTANIDTATASEKGVYVCHVPGRTSVAVAELTMGLILAIDRQIPEGDAELKAGAWNHDRYARANGLMGSQLGIVGLDESGLAVAERAKAFGIVVSAIRDHHHSESTSARIRRVGIRLTDTIGELLSGSDIVSIHLPPSFDGQVLVDESFLSLMRDDAVLINTSNPLLLDEDAVLKAIETSGLKVGLDTYHNQPAFGAGPWKSPLAQHPGVTGTHHIGPLTDQARAWVAAGVVETITSFIAGCVINSVNLDPLPRGAASLCIRHGDEVGVLAAIFEQLRSRGINVAGMSNQVFVGGSTAVATMELASRADDALLAQLRTIQQVIAVTQS